MTQKFKFVWSLWLFVVWRRRTLHLGIMGDGMLPLPIVTSSFAYAGLPSHIYFESVSIISHFPMYRFGCDAIIFTPVRYVLENVLKPRRGNWCFWWIPCLNVDRYVCLWVCVCWWNFGVDMRKLPNDRQKKILVFRVFSRRQGLSIIE